MERYQVALGRVEMAVRIATSYVGNKPLPSEELVPLIESINRALVGVATGKIVVKETAAPPEPAVPVKKSVTDEFIICLEDGRSFKSLKRHLRAKYNMSPEQYRAKWGLPPDYPMVAPNYAQARSNLAKAIGLGQPRDTFGQAA
ncbi:MucR family transcriptional regulator [Methylobacterium persicinum]|nr:MucR family transcriptional regulator [Methylobacterium persicinum]GJE40122.1 Transcriptional regulatory protein ros [Methylobacterium persicinum]